MKTSEVVLAVSNITSCIVFSLLNRRLPLQTKDTIIKIEPTMPRNIPILSSNELISFIFMS